jgi:hypothetical protein
MASKSIPSQDKNSQLEAVRPGLTDDVADPAAASDTVNEGAWKLHDEHVDYQSPKFGTSGKKSA